MSIPTTERGAVTQVIRALKNANYKLFAVNDGGDLVRVNSESQAIRAIFDVDESTLIVKDDLGKRHGVYFVLGNDPIDTPADWHTSIDHVLSPLIDSWL